MQVAFMLYDGFTPLDAIGPYQVLAGVPGTEPVLVAERAGPVKSDSGCSMTAERSLDETVDPEIVVVPGSFAAFHELMSHEPTLDWLRRVHQRTQFTTSVCTGSLLLCAAGLLDGRPATTHWLARDLLASLDVEVVEQRVVEAGKVITSAGVSAGIDMALELVRRMHSDELAQAVQLGIEYDPDPPFDCGAIEKADPMIVDAVTAAFEARGASWLADAKAGGRGGES